MRWLLLLACALLLVPSTSTADDNARTFAFAKGDAGKTPAGWKVATSGKADTAKWSVVADDTAPGKTGHALMQTGTSAGPNFNLCVADDTSYTDLEATVAFQAIAGEGDQGGGIMWRFQDKDNYYVARMNPLEDNLRFYKVVDGKRVELARKEGLKVAAGKWHTIKIKQVGKKVEVWLDGAKHIDVEDETFQKAGKVGLWTKADAQTRFDVFVVQALDKKKT